MPDPTEFDVAEDEGEGRDMALADRDVMLFLVDCTRPMFEKTPDGEV